MIEIVLGPPGTGKTTALLDIVDEELTRGVAPDRIGYFSFTKRAAGEAVDRACKKFKLERDALPHFRTLHSHCYRMLGLRKQEVFQGAPVQAWAREAGVCVTGRWSEDGLLSGFEVGDRILFMENLARVRCISLRQQYDLDNDDLNWHLVERVVEILRAFKARERMLDFTDMLGTYLSEGARPSLETVVIDEAQDLSQLQWRVVDAVCANARRVVVAGDDDQAIYPWAGADVDHFVNMPGAVRVLNKSWRVPRNVQQVAAGIIGRVQHRREKEWFPRDDADGTVDMREYFNAEDLDGTRETMVLARNKHVLDEQVFPALRASGIVYEYNGHSSVNASVRNAITWWERLRRGDTISVAQARVIYEQISTGRVARGYKKLPQFADEDEVDMRRLRNEGGLCVDGVWYEALDRLDPRDVGYVRTALSQGQSISTPKVRVSTIHGSKGGQADHVVVMREMARRTWRDYERDPENEARVWYVACTRARERLTLVQGTTAQEYPI